MKKTTIYMVRHGKTDWNSKGVHPHPIPGVESYPQIFGRVSSYLLSVTDKHFGRNLLVVTHGRVLRAIDFFQNFNQIKHKDSKTLRNL